MRLILLFLLFSISFAKHTLILVDVSSLSETQSNLFKRFLKKSYELYLFRNSNQHDSLSIYTTPHTLVEQVKTQDKNRVYTLVDRLDVKTKQRTCGNWEKILTYFHKNPKTPRPTDVIFVTNSDDPTCGGQASEFSIKMSARELHRQEIKVYPIAYGKDMSYEKWMKKIAGPCSGFFGCVAGRDYLIRTLRN